MCEKTPAGVFLEVRKQGVPLVELREVVGEIPFSLVWSAKSPSAAKLPPFPSDIHDAARRELLSMRLENQRAACADGHWPERSHGLVPEFQVPMPNGAARDCSG